MTDSKIISGVSVSHSLATIDQLEAAADGSQQEMVSQLLAYPGVDESFVVKTCNRVEAYVVTENPVDGETALVELFGHLPADIVDDLDHEESLEHLLRVAAGLESQVLGEDQILGQVRDAYEEAQQVGGLGPLLDDAVTKAIRVGERARTETAINEGVVSLASAAVRLASEKRGLDDATAVVVGAGEMGELAANRLAGHVDELILVNRTLSRAESIADELDGPTDIESHDISEVAETFARGDVVISATGSSEWIVDPETLEAVGDTFVVDITRPRDIPPAADEFGHLTVYDLDRLEAVTEKTRQMRRGAAKHVEAIVDEEFDRLLNQYKRKRADQVISAMYEGAERIKARELEETFEKLDLDAESEAVISSMADTLVSQLLASPTNSLRDAAENDDWTTIHTALRLFNPHLDEEAGGEGLFEGIEPEQLPDSVTDMESAPAVDNTDD